MPRQKNQVDSDPYTKIKSRSIPRTETKLISIPTVKFKQILMPRHKSQAKFDSDTKTKFFSTPTQKLSQFRSLRWNQVKSDPSHWNQVNFDQQKNQVNFDPPLKPGQLRSSL